MSVERRLREGLHRNAGVLDPAVDRLLEDVIRKTRRRVVVRRVALAISVAAVLVLGVVLGPRALNAIRSPSRPVAPPSATSPKLVGEFTRRIEANREVIRSNSMAGIWTIDLSGEGAITVSAPRRFAGVLSNFQFQVTQDRFRTNLFIQDVCADLPVGTYGWNRSGDTLTFTVVDDRCAARVEFFTGGPWHG